MCCFCVSSKTVGRGVRSRKLGGSCPHFGWHRILSCAGPVSFASTGKLFVQPTIWQLLVIPSSHISLTSAMEKQSCCRHQFFNILMQSVNCIIQELSVSWSLFYEYNINLIMFQQHFLVPAARCHIKQFKGDTTKRILRSFNKCIVIQLFKARDCDLWRLLPQKICYSATRTIAR